ncbi:MAG: 4-hydroxy-tetrahydrodipicolinate synthase [Holosporales bacterium]|nr:4-hydroxy-tetrahydrodipicolinate synthase [Holosporales bacterium]
MFSGSIVALVTPFRDGAVDFMSLEKLIKWHIESGTDGILVTGSTGEGLLLTQSEREEIIKTANEIIAKRIPLIAGCSSSSTFESIALAEQAEKAGADAILSIVPFYVKPTQAGIIQHFADIHNNSKLPIILYNNPGRCSVNASVETIITLAAQTRIIALKDSDTNLARVIKIKSQVQNFNLLSGDDVSLVGYLSNGGDGAISVTANVAPQQVAEMIRFWRAGNTKGVNDLNYRLISLSEALFIESNPIPVKYALYVKGFIDNELRKPLTKANDITKNAIELVTEKWRFY